MKFYINTRNGLRVIDLEEVVYLKADGNYTDFHYADGKVKTELSCLSVFEAKIAAFYETQALPMPFYRMGRSHLVNANHISAINFQQRTLSFREDSVKAVVSTKNVLKDLRDRLVDDFQVGD